MSQKIPEVIITNDNNYPLPKEIEGVVFSTLTYLQIDNNVSLSIAFVEEETIIELNNVFSGYAKSTDVLSFEAHIVDPGTGRLFLGDIVICYPFVLKQSTSIGNNLNDELLLMVIHGLLHLLGFSHENEKSKDKMWAVQSQILRLNNIKLQRLPE